MNYNPKDRKNVLMSLKNTLIEILNTDKDEIISPDMNWKLKVLKEGSKNCAGVFACSQHGRFCQRIATVYKDKNEYTAKISCYTDMLGFSYDKEFLNNIESVLNDVCNKQMVKASKKEQTIER